MSAIGNTNSKSNGAPKVWFITGAGRGLGAALANAVLAAGDKVVATGRNPQSVEEALGGPNENLLTLALDVTDEAQAQHAVVGATERFGRIDVLVNNAGYGLIGAVEESSTVEVEAQYRTNVFGLLNVIRAALPTLREQGSGHIINLSSVAGVVGFDQFAIYCSTKFAVEGISESLALELEPFGIHVTSVQPGYFRTDFLTGNSMVMAEAKMPAYDKGLRETFQSYNGKQAGDPVKFASAVQAIVAADNPPLRLAVGPDAVALIESKLESVRNDLDTWREVSISTDIVE
jgi:NAD(P)-dependent dehydrogenase (short-subunit alcohol dehydrogenase family)